MLDKSAGTRIALKLKEFVAYTVEERENFSLSHFSKNFFFIMLKDMM